MTGEERRAMIAEAERWFEQHGLPYFVAGNERRVLATLRRTRLAPVIVVALVVGLAAGVGTGLLTTDVSTGVLVGAVAVAGLVFVYALASLHLQPIARWAVRQTFGSLGWLFPLITRALPLLLLFMTFLFINTEVWQVSSALDRGLLWLTVLLFAAVAVAFLLVRLPEEVRTVSADARGERMVEICKGTPVEDAAREVTGDAAEVELSRLQRANLVLVLLFSQALQVLLLSLSVFVFFIVFGKVAISDSVIRAWLGRGTEDDPIPSHLPTLDWLPVSNELFQVAIFLAAFSGLYFTVYAVTDENYRRQFFTSISDELESAVGVQAVYRALRRDP
jgi:hypothetical protein